MDTPGTPPTSPTPDVDAKLAALQREVERELEVRRTSAPQTAPAPVHTKPRRAGRTLVLLALQIGAFVVLPFLTLIGLAVWAYRVHAVPTWLALGFSGLATLGVLTVYGAKLSHRITGTARVRFIAQYLAAPVVIFYVGYALLYLSSVNAKTDDVRQYYTSVHPLLRLALSTAILADRELVVTDTRRELEDYDRMGLARLDNSLHFEQSDGYVHAVDLRTVGRAEWRTALVVGYFRTLGFKTLRHVGTADHLHVSLAPPGDLRR